MSPTRLGGPTCVVHSCMRPVREHGGYCTAHWLGLSPAQRARLQDERSQITERIDCLEVWWRLPTFDPEAPAP